MDGSGSGVRLYVADDLAAGGRFALESSQAHYLSNVMRLGSGDCVSLFNGRDGEWRARIESAGRGRCEVGIETFSRPQLRAPDLWLVFAPVKRARIDFIAAKATELGVSAIHPMFTRNTAVGRVNVGRLRANAVEAAEQCGRLDVPEVAEPVDLDGLLAGWDTDRRIMLCDETGGGAPVAEVLSNATPGPWAVLTGPEGGFAETELDAFDKLSFLYPVALGPRILRADTAALAALVCFQALVGDWRGEAG